MTGIVKFDEIKLAVSEVYGVPIAMIDSSDRSRPYARARQTLWLVGRNFTALSSTIMGRLTGYRDHSTVVYGYKQAEALMEDDMGSSTMYSMILARLRLWDRLNGPHG